MMPLLAIACACRTATAVNLASVLTAGNPCSRRYCEIMAVISSARADDPAIINPSRKQMSFIGDSRPRSDRDYRHRGGDGNRHIGAVSDCVRPVGRISVA